MAKKSKKNIRRFEYSNRNAYIRVRPSVGSLVGGETFTAGREPGSFKASIRTDSSNSTEVLITRLNEDDSRLRVTLSGREARTLQRALNAHFSACGTTSGYSGDYGYDF